MKDGTHRRKIIVLTAPSGAGKTTIAQRVLEAFPEMRFSISVTTRPPRTYEEDGRDYYFLSEEAFRERVAAGDLLEYEEVYPGRFYGTLRSEVERIAQEQPVLLDVDVKGARAIKDRYADEALAIFISPPSLEELADRLLRRGTEDEEMLRQRLHRAEMEMQQAGTFDRVILNERLDEAVEEAIASVRAFLQNQG